mgnify:CR=1 FL=1
MNHVEIRIAFVDDAASSGDQEARELLLPKRATPGSAGFDLVASQATTIAPGKRALVATGIAVALPPGFEGQIRPRSGLALRHGITCLNSPGTVDADYRGELRVLLINHGDATFAVERGMRIAQLVVAAVAPASFTPVVALDDTLRNAGGFGATGL